MFILYRYNAYSESAATRNLSGIYTLTCQKILGNPYQCNSSYIRPYISVPNMSGEKQKFIVNKGAKIRNRYNQVPHLTQDTNGKVTNSQ